MHTFGVMTPEYCFHGYAYLIVPVPQKMVTCHSIYLSSYGCPEKPM